MPNPGYRKIFEDLDPHNPADEDLNYLALIMSKRAKFPDAGFAESVKKIFGEFFSLDHNPEPIPAGYTYLAQFIIHDISFDDSSNRHRREDHPWNPELKRVPGNLREPNFNLETVYGHKNPINRGEPSRNDLMANTSLPLLKLGEAQGDVMVRGTARTSYPHDVLRKDGSVEANIVDPRNDENLLLAQTLVAFIKFHNAMVLALNEAGTFKDNEELFEKARELTIRYYQTIILTDFLPRIVQDSVLKEVIAKVNTPDLFYHPKHDGMYIPLEFSVAAFRFGHSMIREKYNLNANHFDHSPTGGEDKSAVLDEIMMFTGAGEMDRVRSRLKLPSTWIINWYLFYSIEGSNPNFAEMINTQLPFALLQLRPKIRTPDGRASSIAALDFFRGRRFGLPTGQKIAERMGIEPLDADVLGDLIMNKEIIEVDATPDQALKIKERLRDTFSRETPLWFYILAEAEVQNDGKLGAVGSRIVAETIVQLLYESDYSILQNEWKSDEDFLLDGDKFDMPGMLTFVRDTHRRHFESLYPGRKDFFDELNPLGKGL